MVPEGRLGGTTVAIGLSVIFVRLPEPQPAPSMRLAFLCFLMLLTCRAIARELSFTERLDSSKSVTGKIAVYAEWAYSLRQPDSAIAIAHLARNYARQQKDDKNEIEALALLCDLYHRKKDLQRSDYYFNEAMQLATIKKLRSSELDLYYFKAGMYTGDQQMAEARSYYRKGYMLARELHRTDYQFQYFNDMGMMSNAEADYTTATAFFRDAIRFAKEHRDTFRLHVALNNLADNYSSQNNYGQSITFYLESLRLKELQQDEAHMLPTLINLAWVCNMWNKPEQAMSYARRAMQLGEKSGDPKTKLGAIAIYCDCLDKMGKQEEIRPLALQGLALSNGIAQDNHTAEWKGNLLNYLGKDAARNKAFSKAAAYYREALEAWQQAGYQRGLALLYKDMASLSLQQQQPAQALANLDKSYAIAQQLGSLELKAACSKVYSEIYRQRGNFEKALYYYQQYYRLNDSLYKKETHLQVSEQETRYQTEKKEQTITSLNQERKIQALELGRIRQDRLLIGLVSGIIALLLGGSILANIKIRKQRRLLQTQNNRLEELDKVKTKLFSIISHDLRGLVLPLQQAGKLMNYQVRKEQYDKAGTTALALQQNAETLSGLLDNLLHWSATQLRGYSVKPELIDPSEELQVLIDAFGSFALAKHIRIKSTLPGGLRLETDKGAFHIIFRNLIANALKFTPEQGSIAIDMIEQGQTIQVRISDTGPGMPDSFGSDLSAEGVPIAQPGSAGEKGIGLGLELVRQFCRLIGSNISMESKPSLGSIFTVTFPIRFV